MRSLARTSATEGGVGRHLLPHPRTPATLPSPDLGANYAINPNPARSGYPTPQPDAEADHRRRDTRKLPKRRANQPSIPCSARVVSKNTARSATPSHSSQPVHWTGNAPHTRARGCLDRELVAQCGRTPTHATDLLTCAGEQQIYADNWQRFSC